MAKLDEINEIIKRESDNIISFVNGKKYQSELFENPVEYIPPQARPTVLRGKKGIYIFFLNRDVSLTDTQVRAWNNIKNAPFQNYNAKEMHLGDCFYVGSCKSKSVYSRLGEHFKENISGLKLAAPARNMMQDAVRIVAFPFKKEYESSARCIIPEIEKQLHLSLRPMTGGNRT